MFYCLVNILAQTCLKVLPGWLWFTSDQERLKKKPEISVGIASTSKEILVFYLFKSTLHYAARCVCVCVCVCVCERERETGRVLKVTGNIKTCIVLM